MAKAPKLKQYAVTCAAGQAQRPSPAVGQRILLSIQNTGLNPGLVRFGGDVRQDGGDMTLIAGAFSPLFDQVETCPNDSLNFFSVAGTTFSVIEIVEPVTNG